MSPAPGGHSNNEGCLPEQGESSDRRSATAPSGAGRGFGHLVQQALPEIRTTRGHREQGV